MHADRCHPLTWLTCYAAAPAADVAVNHAPTWVTVAGLLIALGGFVCHAVQTWLRWREAAEARDRKAAELLAEGARIRAAGCLTPNDRRRLS